MKHKSSRPLQKIRTDGADVTWHGSSFRTRAAATGKARSPTVNDLGSGQGSYHRATFHGRRTSTPRLRWTSCSHRELVLDSIPAQVHYRNLALMSISTVRFLQKSRKNIALVTTTWGHSFVKNVEKIIIYRHRKTCSLLKATTENDGKEKQRKTK